MVEVIDRIDDVWRSRLDAFLHALPPEAGACLEHDPRWLDVLTDGFGHRTMALVAHDSGTGDVAGYLPLALVSGRLFGRYLVSLPYLNRAGIVSRDRTTADRLLTRAADLATDCDARYLELRHGQATLDSPLLTAVRDDKSLMVRDLPDDEAVLWKGYDAKVRNQVRKGDKAGLSIRFGGEGLLDGFYDVFAVNMRDLGTPVYGRGLFAAVLRHFADEAELCVVEQGGTPIAAAMLVHDTRRRWTQVPSASSLRSHASTNCNMWMYDRLLRRAIERGGRVFDFGRSSPDSGTWRFKRQWGAGPIPTTWQYHVRRGEVGHLRPDHPRMQRRIETWRKLPVWVTRLVGPPIVRGIP